MEDGDTIVTQTLPNAWNPENKLELALRAPIAAPFIMLLRSSSQCILVPL
jgi:hypothetical protein